MASNFALHCSYAALLAAACKGSGSHVNSEACVEGVVAAYALRLSRAFSEMELDFLRMLKNGKNSNES